MGYSVGRWDGDTFLVETSGFRDRGWLDTRKARPHSDALRVIERFRRPDFGHIEWSLTIDDPKAFEAPFTVTTQLTFTELEGVPEEFRMHAHHWLILHGRYVCVARNPKCAECRIRDLCEFDAKTA